MSENEKFVTGLLTSGWTQTEILASYPKLLTPEEVQACSARIGEDWLDPAMLRDDIIDELHAHRAALYESFNSMRASRGIWPRSSVTTRGSGFRPHQHPTSCPRETESMTITLEIPEEPAGRPGNRAAAMSRESLGLAALKEGLWTEAQLGRFLGLSRIALDQFLKDHGVEIPYTLEDLERERALFEKYAGQ